MIAIALVVIGGIWRASRGIPWVAWTALNNADQYELLSLNPYLSRPDFYDHEIYGRAMIADKAIRDRLNHALEAGVRASDGKLMACFNPRHAIRVTRNGITTDFLICFECRHVQVWRDGREIASFLTSNSPQPVFDDVLGQVGVPLAPKAP